MNDPRSYLGSFLEAMFRSDEHRPALIALIIGISNLEYEHGRSAVRSAINSNDWQQNTRHLMIGGHRFTVVQLLRVFLERKMAWPAEMHMPAVLADEAFVCTRTGLMRGAIFCSNHPDDRAVELLRRVDQPPSIGALRRAARSMASEIEPAFTRKFADILAAQALSLASGSAAEGVIELEELRNDPTIGNFERGWLDLALLNVYKAVGDENKVRQKAVSIAAELVVRHRFRSDE